MSRENVEIVRALFENWNAGDMDAYAALLAPDVILYAPEGWPEPGPFVGPEAVMRQFTQQRGSVDFDVSEPIGDFLDLGDRVLLRFAWRGKGAGPAIDMEFSGVWTIRKGKIRSFEFFWDHAEALETLGMSD